MSVIIITKNGLIKFDTFDLYPAENDALGFEKLLGETSDGDLVAMGTFDEASINLNENIKNLISDFGSQQIKNLRFRLGFQIFTHFLILLKLKFFYNQG